MGMISTVYAIEATVHAPTWEGVYGEIKKVLKPGGIVRFPLLPTLFSILTNTSSPFLPTPHPISPHHIVRRLRMVHDRPVGSQYP